METGPAIVWAAVIGGIALMVAAWLINTNSYERCLNFHGGEQERCAAYRPVPSATQVVP